MDIYNLLPGHQWAAYCPKIDGHLSVEYAQAHLAPCDYYVEQIPIAPVARKSVRHVTKH